MSLKKKNFILVRNEKRYIIFLPSGPSAPATSIMRTNENKPHPIAFLGIGIGIEDLEIRESNIWFSYKKTKKEAVI